MKALLLVSIIILIGLFWSCTRIERIEALNREPVIVFNEMEGVSSFKDSIKLSLKNSQGNYPIRFGLRDLNNNLGSLGYEITDGNGILLQEGREIGGGTIELNSQLNLQYEPLELGNHTIVFTLKDRFGESSGFTLELEAFDNLLPVAEFIVTKPEVSSDPLERVIDASGSYDPDVWFGGGIQAYEYNVLGKIILVRESAIPVIFPKRGVYDISVRVMDNDGVWSEKKEGRIEVWAGFSGFLD